ncbi:hypothetical protein [Butyrivibrio sp. TB]|uniref:hypothetical protein n=1 Tax=Butyrivibrio sp. TB TaxID=1520809 RepID=UPI0008C38233|nr:hypothetical protein [Butyrivibrio sp. TB]SEQ11682.1 hypothetical protein SAMN02910382_02061 [Butyrivibrio sp. TB]
MSIVISIAVFVVSWILGVIGWAQIIGGLQNLKSRGVPMIITIVLWSAIIFISFLCVKHFLSTRILVWTIAMAISLIQVLLQGKIQ